MGIEIEKKFTVKEIPFNLEAYPYHEIEQGYLNVHPAIRVRREDDNYYMTYKGTPFDDKTHDNGIGQVEYNMPLDQISYEHMSAKADGNMIRKRRYLIPINEDAFSKEYLDKDIQLKEAVSKGEIKIELDVFKAPFEGRMLAEVEFPSEEAASNYNPAKWFFEDVTGDRRYSNSQMSLENIQEK